MNIRHYHKINSIFKRNEQGDFTLEFSVPEIEYLKDNHWHWEEKVDGTNIGVVWDGEKVKFLGKTKKAIIPPYLLEILDEIFTPEKLRTQFTSASIISPVILFGEGIGYKIQAAGKNYLPDSHGFVLFDIWVGRWLRREDVYGIADKLKIPFATCVGFGTIEEAIKVVKRGFKSTLTKEECLAEGMILRPKSELYNQYGRRIITKLTTKSFK